MHEVVVHVLELESHFVLHCLDLRPPQGLEATLASLIDPIDQAFEFVFAAVGLAESVADAVSQVGDDVGLALYYSSH